MLNKIMHLVDNLSGEAVEMAETWRGYDKGLVEAAGENPGLVVLSGDPAGSEKTMEFQQKFPERFYEMGVSGQNITAAACEMALVGKIPFIISNTEFIPGRFFEQVKLANASGNINVKISGVHADLSISPDETSHQVMEDTVIMRTLPGMTVIVPCDYEETRKAVIAASRFEGPVYLRSGRIPVPAITTEKTPFEIGKANILKDGSDVAIIACGSMVYEALTAAEELEKDGVYAMVINMHTIKPLDVDTVIYAARKCGAIVTAEDHRVTGGLGSAIAEVQVRFHPVPQEFVGMHDSLGESGKSCELMEKYGMKRDVVKQKVMQVIKLKHKDYIVESPV
jgi:transketolase